MGRTAGETLHQHGLVIDRSDRAPSFVFLGDDTASAEALVWVVYVGMSLGEPG